MTFTLLSALQGTFKAPDCNPIKSIEHARAVLNIYNKSVEHIWSLKIRIANEVDIARKLELNEQLDALQKLMAEHLCEESINKLIVEVGPGEQNTSTPYRL